MKLKNLLLSTLFALALVSCNSSKTVLPYFTDIIDIPEGTLPVIDYMPIIQPDDELFISVTSEFPEASAIYNLPATNPAKRDALVSQTSARSLTYIVDSKGDINFPILGKLHVAGMTTEQLKDELYTLIRKDVKDPVINVQMVNFTVVVAGEVKQPQTIKVERNRISVIDALAKAGDLTEYGERSNVLVIREEDGIRTYAHLDLNDSKTLTSPYFYLKQNDYVYVAPNKVRQSNSKYNQNNAYKLSLTSTIVSTVSVIASLVIAFTR
ncbi:MAG: polysaccharide biosynthesis/export family protein [Muribaculaceae bacterium]|nr:polysaccharide biosynthesis/export family protein [Muribaculaceae bacterium]MDE6197366.1 polysaccharide biosynthesis/export family protein [Muribaculaceae bacterium]